VERYGTPTRGRKVLHRLLGILAAVGLTVLFFLVLPLIQAISRPPKSDVELTDVDTAALPPPPPPPIEEPEEEPEEEEPPPEMREEAPPLDLAQLDLALNPGVGDGWGSADFELDLKTLAGGGGGGLGDILDAGDLDQKPRPTYQPSPVIDAKIRKAAPGSVYITFVVDADGRVQEPQVQRSTDPVFERSALAAIKKWRFEPGKRKGEPVAFKMRVPITFPKS
jgi:protein TonB